MNDLDQKVSTTCKIYKIRKISDQTYLAKYGWCFETIDKAKIFKSVQAAKRDLRPQLCRYDKTPCEIVEFELTETRSAGEAEGFRFPKSDAEKKVKPIVKDPWL